jgi:septal ring factor EnvC (AmiA/AmiB activator)
MDINLLSIGLGIICTLVGIGWKLGTYLGDIKTSVARIETLLAAQSQRMDRIEDDVKRIEQDVKQIQKEINWNE